MSQQNTKKDGDGSYTVVQAGQRVTREALTKDGAEALAKQHNQLNERAGQTGGKAEVKQNLFG